MERDVRFDVVVELVMDGANGEVAFQFFECLLYFGQAARKNTTFVFLFGSVKHLYAEQRPT